MKTFQDSGIVLKTIAAGESNKRVVLLLKEHGKVVVSAKGAQNAKSKLAAVTQPFACCEFKLYQGSGFLSLTQGSVIEGFHNISAELERFYAGCYMLELTDAVILPEMPAQAALQLLYISLKKITAGTNHLLVRAVFEFKLLQYEGFEPIMEWCSCCNADPPLTHFGGNGALCAACAAHHPASPITAPCLEAIMHVLNSETKQLFSFNISDAIINELSAAATVFRQSNIDVEFKSI